MKRPEQLDADALWLLLGKYANEVGEAEGVLFTRDRDVMLAADQYYKEYLKNDD